MLGFVLLAHNEGRQLELGLRALGQALEPGDPLLLIDAGSQDGSLELLQIFADEAGRQAEILRLQEPGLSLAEAAQLARQQTGADYVLAMTGQDLLLPNVVAPLKAMLKAQKPDLMICNHSWWVAGVGAPLACVDASRVAGGEEAAQLLPDLRRLLPTSALAARLETPAATTALAEWQAYDTWLAAAQSLAVFPEPVLLRPLPVERLGSMFDDLVALLQGSPKRQCRMILQQQLPRISDEMILCDPAQAEADIASAVRFYSALNEDDQRWAAQFPGPVGELMAAVCSGEPAAVRMVLSLQASTQDRARLLALTAEIRQLREDLDLALPGPEYLLELYQRLRRI